MYKQPQSFHGVKNFVPHLCTHGVAGLQPTRYAQVCSLGLPGTNDNPHTFFCCRKSIHSVCCRKTGEKVSAHIITARVSKQVPAKPSVKGQEVHATHHDVMVADDISISLLQENEASRLVIPPELWSWTLPYMLISGIPYFGVLFWSALDQGAGLDIMISKGESCRRNSFQSHENCKGPVWAGQGSSGTGMGSGESSRWHAPICGESR